MNKTELLESCLLLEEPLSTKDRNALPDNSFGLPSQRKFPLNDKDHVLQAIKMFNRCPEKDRKELAKNIQKACKEFDVKISKDSLINKYL